MVNQFMRPTWTVEREGVMLFLLQYGHTAEKAASMVGVTKSAVIGHVNRLDLQVGILRKVKLLGGRPVKPKLIPLKRAAKKDIIMPVLAPDPCTIAYLSDHRCHWPMWDDKTTILDRMYCGAPVAGKVYCAAHWQKGTTKGYTSQRSNREPPRPFLIKRRALTLPKSMVL